MEKGPRWTRHLKIPPSLGPPNGEPPPPLHSSARHDCFAYGGDPDRRGCRLHQAANLGITRGGVSDDPGSDLLSGSQSGCDVVRRHSTAGEAIWTNTWSDADDIDQFGW